MSTQSGERWQSRLTRRSAKSWRFALSGVALTLFVAWGLPLLLAARGIGPADSPMSLWHRGPASELWDGRAPSLSVRRSAFSDWYIAEPVRTAVDGRTHWPDVDLEDANGRARSAPRSVVIAPPTEQSASWGRIDTGLAGWPFRAFASEAWYPRGREETYQPLPEFRGNAHLGLVLGQHILVPLRPLPLGILLNICFWATVSWCAIAGPRAIRSHRRAKYGRCPKCGYEVGKHEVKRPGICPECGASFVRDPLGFAHTPEMHFQTAYVWIIFISSLDIMLTWKILDHGGIEVNPLAASVIDAWGMQGAVAFKFALMMWVIVVCEILARLRRSAGKFLAYTAIIVSASPVLWSLALLTAREFFPAMLE